MITNYLRIVSGTICLPLLSEKKKSKSLRLAFLDVSHHLQASAELSTRARARACVYLSRHRATFRSTKRFSKITIFFRTRRSSSRSFQSHHTLHVLISEKIFTGTYSVWISVHGISTFAYRQVFLEFVADVSGNGYNEHYARKDDVSVMNRPGT